MGREGRVRENKESFDISPHSPPPLDLSSRESEGPSLTLPFHFERRGRLLGGRRLRRRRGGGREGVVGKQGERFDKDKVSFLFILRTVLLASLSALDMFLIQ